MNDPPAENVPQEGHQDEIYDGFGVFERQNQALKVEENDSHTVLFNLPLPEDVNDLPVPKVGDDKWDSEHVKFPSSASCKYNEIGEDGRVREKARWELIKASLMEAPIKNSRDLERAIKKYNTKFVDEWNFSLLHELFEDVFSDEDSDYFFDHVVTKIIELALRLPELIKSPIPLLQKKMNHSVSMSQEQAGCILANAFLCTFPRRNGGRKHTDFPEINFNRLFSQPDAKCLEKLKCICFYFKRIFDKMPAGVLTFQRRFIGPLSCPEWEKSDLKFSSMKFVSSTTTIEDCGGMLQVDFANRYLGGGVLGWGCVQEEIRFVINPEMIVGMLFCESMNSYEAIVMTGCEQFSKYTGYAQTFEWNGCFNDLTPSDVYRRKLHNVVAIDALSFHKPHLQFEDFPLMREANKAFIGFYHDAEDDSKPIPVSSGNWGCGVFRGSKTLKALIQMMACCSNRRNLMYCTFGEDNLATQIHEMFDFLTENEITIGQVWRYLKTFKEKGLTNRPDDLYSFIYWLHRKDELQELAEPVTDSAIEEGDNGPSSCKANHPEVSLSGGESLEAISSRAESLEAISSKGESHEAFSSRAESLESWSSAEATSSRVENPNAESEVTSNTKRISELIVDFNENRPSKKLKIDDDAESDDELLRDLKQIEEKLQMGQFAKVDSSHGMLMAEETGEKLSEAVVVDLKENLEVPANPTTTVEMPDDTEDVSADVDDVEDIEDDEVIEDTANSTRCPKPKEEPAPSYYKSVGKSVKTTLTKITSYFFPKT